MLFGCVRWTLLLPMAVYKFPTKANFEMDVFFTVALYCVHVRGIWLLV